MKVFWFIMLAGYAVRCDDNNYYVIEMVDEPTQKPFKVYWNVPTKQCKSKKIPFEGLYEKFGIIQNANDSFQGEKVTILYDPGLFPALLKNETSGRFKFRNGGVPQEGDLAKHLEAFKYELDQSIPEEDFDGVGVIDFESWRPVYRQNFGVLRPYKDVSFEIERKLHWWWQKRWLEAEAKKRFEEAARTFMESTILLARRLRPRAQWGFYGFPYCFNMASNNMQEACAANVPEENDQIRWLWEASLAVFPSVYSGAGLGAGGLAALVRGRVREAARAHRPVLPYFWYRYRDGGFLTQVDLTAALETLYKSNASGIIIWGSSSDVNTVQKCTKLLNYVESFFGPAIAKYTKPQNTLQDSMGDINNSITEGYDITTINSSDKVTNRTKELDPEYHWTPPENYTQEIENHVAKEIIKKLTNYSTTDVHNEEVLENNNVLIELILKSVLNRENTSDLDTLTTSLHSQTELNVVFTSTTTEVTKLLQPETTSISSPSIMILHDDERTSKSDSISISSTESVELVKAKNDSNFYTSTNYEIVDEDAVTLDPTQSSSDNIVTDFSESKNSKKTSIQNSLEEYFDVTTDTAFITETTDTTNFDVNTTEKDEEYGDYSVITNSNKKFAGETTEPNDYTTKVIEKTTTSADDFDKNAAEFSTFATDLPASPNASQLSIINENGNETLASVILVAKETDFIVKSTTENYISTKITDKTETTGLENNLSTEKESNEANQTSLQENTEAEIISTNDDTSLTSTSTSPEQVVVYV